MSALRVEIQNQILGHAVAVAGTPFGLHYRSDRVPGRRAAYRLSIPLSNGPVPPGVKEIVLEVDVAGQRVRERRTPGQFSPYAFRWDGKDGAGRPAQGKQAALIRLGYVYGAAYPRPELTRWLERRQAVGVWDARICGLGGWTLSVHHAYDPVGRVVYMGNGRRRSGVDLDDLAGELLMPDGTLERVYVFDRTGRHLRTVHGLTGGLLYQFAYDSDGFLAAVDDGQGNRTRIERGAHGTPAAIVAPWGARTDLEVDAAGYLSRIVNPMHAAVECRYAVEGLLSELTDPNERTHHCRYDDEGRVIEITDPGGATTRLVRRESNGDWLVVRLTAEGRESSYRGERPAPGERRLVSRCCGRGETELVGTATGWRIRDAEGTEIAVEDEEDPRWGRRARVVRKVAATLPDGVTRAITRDRTVELAEAHNPLRVQTLTDHVDINGQRFAFRYDAATRTVAVRTPGGREVRAALDERGRVIEAGTSGLFPTKWVYDERGRITQLVRGTGPGTRVANAVYDAAGRLTSLTGAAGQAVRYEYDGTGAMTKKTLADGREVGYAYDPGGNLTALTPPGRSVHAFAYTPADRLARYRAPRIGPEEAVTEFAYNADQQLTLIRRPDGQTVTIAYDGAGNLSTVAYAGDDVRFAFDTTSGVPKAIAAREVSISYAYLGPLLTSVAWRGAIAGEVRFAYEGFRVASVSVNGTRGPERGYDPDGLLARLGAMRLARGEADGLVRETTLGRVRTLHDHTGFGEAQQIRALYDDRVLYAAAYERDSFGRLTALTETVQGQTRQYAYTYDAAGRLAELRVDDEPLARYQYDSNGNRVGYSRRGRDHRAQYDARDRIVTCGEMRYVHRASGEWAERHGPHGTDTYGYDALGNLRAVRLAGGPLIEYVIDGAGRRVGKKLDGRVLQGWLYQDRLKPVAELDGASTVVSRFVYGTQVNVPEYMERGGRTYRILTDHLGSPRLVVDVETGEVAQRLTYDECGNVLEDTRPGFQPFGFAGGLYDAQTGLVRLGVRDYDAATGRWTAPDPILFSSQEPNLYAYASGDPINRTDPTGQDPIEYIIWVGPNRWMTLGNPHEEGLPMPGTPPVREVHVPTLQELLGLEPETPPADTSPAPPPPRPPRRPPRRPPPFCGPRCGLNCIEADTSGVTVSPEPDTAMAIRG